MVALRCSNWLKTLTLEVCGGFHFVKSITLRGFSTQHQSVCVNFFEEQSFE